jgi:hypothetical protein
MWNLPGPAGGEGGDGDEGRAVDSINQLADVLTKMVEVHWPAGGVLGLALGGDFSKDGGSCHFKYPNSQVSHFRWNML